MAAVIRTVLATLVAAATASGCHSAGCREGDFACAALTDSAPTTDETSSTTSTPTSTTPDTGTTETPTTGLTMTSPAVCGDGVVEAGEACDDGNSDDLDACKSDCTPTRCGDGIVQAGEACDDGDDDDTDNCVGECQVASCGDGFIRAGIEVCDDGAANDDAAYGGCTAACLPGPRCGDAVINGPEECDDNNDDEHDGCMSSCIEAQSCLQIQEVLPAATTGIYRLWPPALGGEGSVVAWCDMDTDGGGYTFLKVDTEFGNESDKGAKKADELCKKYGMRLLVTRTPEHTVAAYKFATTSNLSPIGGGNLNSGVDYLAMLAIYPISPGATCGTGALNSAECPGWRAGDDMPFWVSSTQYADQPDAEHCAGCSMIYKWNPDGTLKSYMTVSFGEGASSYRFLCDIGDKHP